MICISKNKQGAEILMDYCAGKLDPARAAEFEAHLRDCEECRKLAAAQDSLWQALDVWTPVEVSPGFDEKLYKRIGSEPAGFRWRAIFRPIWKPLLPLAAVGAILVTLFVRTPVPSSPAPSSNAQQRVDVIQNADQVEQALDDMNLLAPVAPSNPI
ncbi:MAG TPA: zf-HC2 domain-containing protein [Bryobacteraceae bacterium]|nr:zf-HC2 domain-containing protein [Bryobacteraceae bacterium]